MKKAIILLLFSFSLASISQAQKVKYEDLFTLLEAKKYDVAAPILIAFIKDPKNSDHANAMLQMAKMYEHEALQYDVLKETAVMNVKVDSAVLYYDQALKLVDEKELKRNDEFYEEYNRRDVRTGKFGIKLADVQFDLQKRKEALQKRKVQVNDLAQALEQSQASYEEAEKAFLAIKEKYPTRKTLYLRTDATLLEAVEGVRRHFTNAIDQFDTYKALLGRIENVSYQQSLTLQPIDYNQYNNEEHPDFFASEIIFLDYKAWAYALKKVAEEVITPLRKKLVLHDVAINDALEKVKSGIMVAQEEVAALAPPNELRETLVSIDPDALPLHLYALKLAELEYYIAVLKNRDNKDSLNIMHQFTAANNSMHKLNKMDTIHIHLQGMDIPTEAMNYSAYVSAQYSGEAGLTSYLTQQADFVSEEKNQKNSKLVALSERSKWLIYEGDSIPLFDVKKDTMHHSPFLPLVIGEKVTVGLYYPETGAPKGYFAVINDTRVPDVYTKYTIDTTRFNKRNMEKINTKIVSDDGNLIYFIMLCLPTDGMPVEKGAALKKPYIASVSKIYISDGLAWTKPISLDALPTMLKYKNATAELIISYDTETVPEGGSVQLVIDKKGEEVVPQ